MEHLYVTVIGGDTAAHAERIFDDLRLKSVNQIKDRALGRFKFSQKTRTIMKRTWEYKPAGGPVGIQIPSQPIAQS